ncbi:MAG: NAD(P)/FAD-dependent oxidoreductase, partial [Bacteroidales bacterium]
MEHELLIPAQGQKERIVIIGGGFGGLRLAEDLDMNQYQVILIDRNNYHQFQPLFYQVATSGLESSDISFPFRKIFQKKADFHFRLCEAQSIDSSNKILNTSAGKLHFDYLVIATGCTTNFFGHNEYNDFVYTLKSTAESLQLRNQILQSLEDTLNKEVSGFN